MYVCGLLVTRKIVSNNRNLLTTKYSVQTLIYFIYNKIISLISSSSFQPTQVTRLFTLLIDDFVIYVIYIYVHRSYNLNNMQYFHPL
jgi:hypothetical protein